MKFTPVKTFYSPEFESTYLKGFSYTVRPGNLLLDELSKRWLAEGKIKEVEQGPRLVKGEGIVK